MGKDRSKFTHMGYSVRTDVWRYTEWVAWNGTTLKPIWDQVVARELYDHRDEVHYPTNFDAGEKDNVVNNSSHAAVVTELSQMIPAQFGIDYESQPPLNVV